MSDKQHAIRHSNTGENLQTNKVYLDVEGYPNSKVLTIATLSLNPNLTPEQLKKLKKNIKKIKEKASSIDYNSPAYEKFLKELFNWALFSKAFKINLYSSLSNFNNNQVQRICKLASMNCDKFYKSPRKSKTYTTISSSYKETDGFRRYRYDKYKKKKVVKKNSISYLIRKYFRNTRFGLDRSNSYFLWLLHEINVSYNKVMKFNVYDTEKEPSSQVVKNRIAALTPLVENPEFNAKSIFFIDAIKGDI